MIDFNQHTIQYFFQHTPSLSGLLAVVLFNSLFSMVLSFAFVMLLWKRWHHYRGRLWLLFTSISACLPLLGLFAVIVCVLYLLLKKSRVVDQNVLILEPGKYYPEKIVTPFIVEAGGLRPAVVDKRIAVNTRLRALLAINAQPNRVANYVNHQELNDDEDALRLQAFALLEKQEKQINQAIYELNCRYQETSNQVERAQCAKRLAERYWDFIYLNILQGKARQSYLGFALHYAKIARRYCKHDPSILLMMGKIYLSLQKQRLALICFKKALIFSSAKNQALSYMASIHYQRKEFDLVKQCLSQCENLHDFPQLEAIKKFWAPQEATSYVTIKKKQYPSAA